MKKGFSLIELLVVIAILAILSSLLAAGITGAIGNGQAGACKSNLRQLSIANGLHASDRNDHFVPAASDLMGSNQHRWHGVREGRRLPFDASRGPLVPYLEDAAESRACPTLKAVRKSSSENAFEASCGGYGYNAIGIGSMSYITGFNGHSARTGLRRALLQNPMSTVMFADTAFPQPYRNPDYLIEYSFAEPYFFLNWNTNTESSRQATASIHFRHRKQTTQIAWADGHVKPMPLEQGIRASGGGKAFDMGWPGGPDNALFKP